MENVAQTSIAQTGIRMLLGPIPAAIFIAAIIVLYTYPITAERYAQILKDIEKMEAGSS